MTAYPFTTTMSAFSVKNSSISTSQSSQATLGMPPDPGRFCPSDSSSLQVLLTVFYCLFFVLGLVGNLLALWVFLRVHSKNNSVHVFLINVALADLLLVACLPFRVWYHSRGNHWELGSTVCKLVGNLFYMNMYISITLMGLISVDRYLKIKQRAGKQHRLPAAWWSKATCAVIWILACALNLVFVLSNSHEESNRCFQYRQLQHARWKGWVNLMMVVMFWITFFSMVVSYIKIAFKLLRRSREKPDLPNAPLYARTARKSFFILFLFTVCFVPYHIVRVFYIITQLTDTSCYWRGVADQANEVALLFSALNSCLDPVMYFLLSSSVRKQVMRLLGNVIRAWEGGVSGSSSSLE